MPKQAQGARESGQRNRIPSAAPAAAASISISDLYPLAEFQARTGLSNAAMRAARRRGLPVLRTGKRAFVLGQDFLTFLREQARA